MSELLAVTTAGLGEQLWLGLLNGVIVVVFATGLVVLFGVMRVVNMAHGAFFMLGAMSVFACQKWLHTPYGLGLLIAGVGVGIGGIFLNRVIVGPIERRVRGGEQGKSAAVLLETMAISLVLYNAAVLTFGPTTRPVDSGLTGVTRVAGIAITAESVMVLAVGLAVVGALHIFFARSRLGKCMRAASETRVGASLVGIDIRRMYDWAWFFGCGLAATAGILIAPLSAADPGMGQDVLIYGFAVIVVAGLTSFVGVTVLAIALGLAGALFGQFVSTYYQPVFIFGVMIVLLLIRPEGLFGTARPVTAVESATAES
jgi:branched-chain amino acid transport system permease protein